MVSEEKTLMGFYFIKICLICIININQLNEKISWKHSEYLLNYS